jgi:anti-sigma factor RsiW
MNCTHIEKIIPLYAGGDLGGKDESAVAAHLRSCDSCRLLAEGYRRSQELLLSYEAPEFGSAFFDGIRSAVLEEHARTTATKHLTLFQRARNFIRESLPDARLFSPRVAGFATLLVAVALAFVFFNASTRRQPVESANAGKALPGASATTSATNSPQPQEQQRAALPDSSPDPKRAETPLETGRTGTVEKTLAATVRPEARRRTIQLVARSGGTAEHQPKLFKDESLLPGEETYLDAISKLDRVIRERDGTISSTLRAEYERNLTDVDRAIASTRKAALKHRNDPEMTDFMFAAYRGKVVLLSEVAKQTQSTASEF